MSLLKANIKTHKSCAFCKHWYDPGNTYIKPIAIRMGQWEYDIMAKCPCAKKNHDTKGADWCHLYECKINY